MREESKCSARYPSINEFDPPTKTGILPRLTIDSAIVVAIDRKMVEKNHH
jgi:hypothetical protein